jgi:hypothetical protein
MLVFDFATLTDFWVLPTQASFFPCTHLLETKDLSSWQKKAASVVQIPPGEMNTKSTTFLGHGFSFELNK